MGMELLELFETAKKAADAAAAADAGSTYEIRCIDALRVLKSFPVNTKILVDTQVGKGLQRLKKHPRKKIQAYAADLIGMWKNIITEEANRNKNQKPDNKLHSKGDGKKRPAVVVKSDSDSVLTQDLKSPSSVSSWPPKATSKTPCNEAARDNVRKLLWEGLCKVYGEADESIRDEIKACDTLRVAISVESALFEQWGCSATGPCRAKYRSIVFNLKDQKNPDFRRKVLLGHIKAESIPSLTTEEMASDDRKLENELIRIKALLHSERGDEEEATTDQFKCGRCGERKTSYRQMQTRSADEPMTTFVVCRNCNNRWKFC